MLVADKPAGPTSHDVVDHVRRSRARGAWGTRARFDPLRHRRPARVRGQGHALARFPAAGEKTYRATARRRFATTTTDGRHRATPSAPRESPWTGAQRGEAGRPHRVGEQMQVPPAYSAKRSGGERLYDLPAAAWP